MVDRANARTVAAAEPGSKPRDRISVPSSWVVGVQPKRARARQIAGQSSLPILVQWTTMCSGVSRHKTGGNGDKESAFAQLGVAG